MRKLIDQPMPPYSYVPGLFPHPQSDPRGHRVGVLSRPQESEEVWYHSVAFLRGIDLFNHGYYWEAHEAWEHVWIQAGRRGVVADFLKGLIKLAAALVKAREGSGSGVERHARRAVELLAPDEAAEIAAPAGFDMEELVQFARGLAESPSDVLDPRPEPVVRVVPFQLLQGRRSEEQGDA